MALLIRDQKNCYALNVAILRKNGRGLNEYMQNIATFQLLSMEV